MGELFEVNAIKGDRSYLFKSCLEEGIISFIQQLRLGQQEFGSVWISGNSLIQPLSYSLIQPLSDGLMLQIMLIHKVGSQSLDSIVVPLMLSD